MQNKIIHEYKGLACCFSALLLLSLISCNLVAAPAVGVSAGAVHGYPHTRPFGRPQFASRHILIRPDPAANAKQVLARASARGLRKQGRIYGSDWYTVSIPANADPRAMAAMARNISGVAAATLDPIVRLHQVPPRDPLYIDDDDPTTKSCDPLLEICDPLLLVDQWGMFKVGAENGWSETTGSSSVVIAILDSGVDLDHDDLATNIWVNPGEIPGNGIDDDSNGFVDDIHGADFCGDNVGDPQTDDVSSQDANPDIPMGGSWVEDPLALPFGTRFVGDPAVGDGIDNNSDLVPDLGVFHGTFVAAIAAAMTDNINTETGEYEGVAGSCWNCKIMPVRMVNAEGEAFGSDAAAAINYASAMGADVINISWGFDTTGLDTDGEAEVAVISDAINSAVSAGVIVVASAGNSYASPVTFPAAMHNTVAVGSSNWLDRRSDFSNFSSAGEVPDDGIDNDNNGWIDDVLDILAPGDHIWSGYVYGAYFALQEQILGDPSVVPGLDSYSSSSGTSYSAPMVSGYIGLLLSRFPDATLDDVRQVIRENAVDLIDPEGTGANLVGYDSYSGYGRMQMVVPQTLGNSPDQDGDGLSDADEDVVGTDPAVADTDGDGLSDGYEVNYGAGAPDTYTPGEDLNPLLNDTDGDGVGDGDELLAATDPLDVANSPADGDVNIDGRVDVVDLLLARRALLGEYEFGDIPRLHADVAPLADGVPRPDGEFNLGDVLVIQRMALGL